MTLIRRLRLKVVVWLAPRVGLLAIEVAKLERNRGTPVALWSAYRYEDYAIECLDLLQAAQEELKTCAR